MYDKLFVIDSPVGNNAFSFEKREDKRIYVASLIEGSFDDVKIGDKPAFIEINEKGEEVAYKGLKNFIRTVWNNVPVYIFDNHNHAFYFWHELGLKNIKLVHIDEHHDTRTPESFDLDSIFQYTNHVLNVGNYIVPAIRTGLIDEVFSITGESDLLRYENFNIDGDYILNLDLDFFSPELDYIDFELKKKIILDFAKKAKLITISTSPYFIDQDLAIETMKKLFS